MHFEINRSLVSMAACVSQQAIFYIIFVLALAAVFHCSTVHAGNPNSGTDIFFPDDARVVNVKNAPYGARGDGVTDDTDAINRALRRDAVKLENAFMSRTIYFPAGIYLVSDTLEPMESMSRTKNTSTIRIIGQSAATSVLKLKDNAPGFERSDRPKYLLRTGNSGEQPNTGFGNYIQHLTIDIGSDNPGAVGVRFDVANCGAMKHVRIISSDPDRVGVYGLSFFSTAGPGYVDDVEIQGFDLGVYLDSTSVNNLAFERIRLTQQRVAGILNVGKNIAIRSLKSDNSVPALQLITSTAAVFLVDAQLRGNGSGPAITLEADSFLYARDLSVENYGTAIKSSKESDPNTSGTITLPEWWSHTPIKLPNGDYSVSLRLPIKNAPEYENVDFANWANVEAFGARSDDNRSDSDAFQKAVDSGKKIIYAPLGVYDFDKSVVIRGDVRKIDFLFSKLKAISGKQPILQVENVIGDTVVLENISTALPIVHNSSSAVVLRNVGGPSDVQTGSSAAGDLFIENAGPHARIAIKNNIRAWLRSINRETAPFLNDRSTVWYFSDNIERMQDKHSRKVFVNPLKTIHGTTELIGGAMDALYVAHKPVHGPLIESIDSHVSVAYAGELRFKPPAWGSWPLHVHARNGAQEVVISENDVLEFSSKNRRVKRIVLPMYSTSPNAAAKP